MYYAKKGQEVVNIPRTIDKNDVNKKSKHNSFYYILFLLLFLIALLELLALNSKFGYADSGNSAVPVESEYNAEIQNASYEKAEDNTKIVMKEITGAPSIAQLPELPTGCEAVAATMLLKWAGINVEKEDVARALPKGWLPSRQNGAIYGSNPNSVFIGDPFSDNGLGVYHQPIASLIESFLPGQSKDITGAKFESILKEIDGGRPVIVWATMNMAEPNLIATWHDGKGGRVKWIAPEHAFLLTGYTDNDVIVNDPYTGKRQLYSISLFKDRWESMGSQAVTVSDSMSGNVVVTDVTSLSDAKSALSLKGVDTSEPKAPVVKKSEQAISEMTKPLINETDTRKFKIYFKEIYNEVSITLRSWYDGVVRFFNE